jgi:hypothetical protein
LLTTAVLVLRTFYQARADFEAVAEGTTTSPSMMAELALIGNVSSHRSLDGSSPGTIKSNTHRGFMTTSLISQTSPSLRQSKRTFPFC